MTDIFKDFLPRNAGFMPLDEGSAPDFTSRQNICLEMAGWTPDAWEPSEPFGPFPILDVCPSAPAYFAEAGHLTNRDLRTLASFMNLDVDFRNAEEIYRVLLRRSQDTPWILPFLEIYLRDSRSGKVGPGSRRRAKDDKIIWKMPLSKLGLRYQPRLHDRVDELRHSPVPVDIGVAAFCEYAVKTFFLCSSDLLIEESLESALVALRTDDPAERARLILGDIEEVESWFEHASKIIHVASDAPDMTSEALHEHAVEALGQMSFDLSTASPSDMFGLVMRIAAIARDQAERVSVDRRTSLLAELSASGVDLDPLSVKEGPIALMECLRDHGVIDELKSREEEVEEQRRVSDDLKAQISAAYDTDDFELLGEIAPKASRAKQSVSDACARRDRLLALIKSFAVEQKEDPETLRNHLFAILDEVGVIPDADEDDDMHASLSAALGADVDGAGGDAAAASPGAGADVAEDPGVASETGVTDNTDEGFPDPEGCALPEVGHPDAGAPDAHASADGAVEHDDPDRRSLAPEDADRAGTGASSGGRAARRAHHDDGQAVPVADGGADPYHDAGGGAADDDPVDDRLASDSLAAGDGSMDTSESSAGVPVMGEGAGPRKAAPRKDTGIAADDAPAARGAPTVGSDPAVPGAEEESVPGAPVETLADLVERDLVGIAADAAESFEARREGWPIKATALRAAAGSRASHREYGADAQRFLSIANRATGEQQGDIGSVMLLGALIRPSIFEKSSGLRSSLSELCRGSLGRHLQQAAEAISGLDYNFPPDSDELARLSGAQREPKRQRLAAQLDEWCEKYARKTSRWPFATAFMHHVVSDSGPIGAARAAIRAGSPDAAGLARKALSDLGSPSEIEDRSAEFGLSINRTELKLHPRGIDYLSRQFDEPLGLLDAWVRDAEREKSHDKKPQARFRTTIGNLQSRLEKALQGLRQEREENDDTLTRAVAHWIVLRVEETLRALKGHDASLFATLEEAFTAERDLLPAAARDCIEQTGPCDAALRDAILTCGYLEPADALVRARKEGAFDTAFRLAERFDPGVESVIHRDMAAFAETWGPEIEKRVRRLRTLRKLDYKYQEEITRWTSYCEIVMPRIDAIGKGTEIRDLADIPALVEEIDHTCILIETNIRADQADRIRQYRNEQNADEADTLVSGLEDLNIESIEDRIAQLRDGRSAATFETELQGAIADFNPAFLSFASSNEWPSSASARREASASESPLFIEEDRRAAGLDFIEIYRAIKASAARRKPDTAKIREFLEAVGFERVKIHGLDPVGRSNAWNGEISAEIRSVGADDWFLPPIFGSQATAGYRLLLVGPDVLPEVIVKALSTEMPAILIMCGVVDAARRHELAERMRANAIPALLIDEALATFTATRRQTRARTIFECGLPYGRVDPYTTDAGALPPEMFFGREEEIRHIMSRTADGCLVYGGRQLGKSALLGHVSRTRHAPENDIIVVRRDVKSLGIPRRPPRSGPILPACCRRRWCRPAAGRPTPFLAISATGSRARLAAGSCACSTRPTISWMPIHATTTPS